MARKPYPSDVSDDKWAFVVPYLTLMSEEAPLRDHALREVFNGLRWIVRAGARLSDAAQRFATVRGGVSTDSALAPGGRL